MASRGEGLQGFSPRFFCRRGVRILPCDRAAQTKAAIEQNGKNHKETDLVRIKEAKIRSFVGKKSRQYWLGG